MTAGDGVRVTNVGSNYTVHGVSGSCSLETFEPTAGTGNATTDQAAWEAALAALAAGTYTHLELGAKTYEMTQGQMWTAATRLAIKGQGPTSRIHLADTVTTAAFVVRFATDAHFEAFEIYGNAAYSVTGVQTAPGGGANQIGIATGYLGGDGVSRLRIVNVTCHNLGGAGFSWAYGPDFRGPEINDCSAYQCDIGFAAYDAGTVTNFQAYRCAVGFIVGSGNIFATGGDIVQCATGVDIIPGGNAAHGAFGNVTIWHAMVAARIRAIANGHLFVGCTFYDGTLLFDGGNDTVVFSSCLMDCAVYTLAGKALFTSMRFDQSYFVSAAVTGENRFVECRDIDGSIPSWIAERVRRSYTFPNDADQMLSPQDSVAEILAVEPGVITAERAITNALAPNKSNRQLVKNGTAQTLTYRWATGAAVALGAGLNALIGADGADATIEL